MLEKLAQAARELDVLGFYEDADDVEHILRRQATRFVPSVRAVDDETEDEDSFQVPSIIPQDFGPINTGGKDFQRLLEGNPLARKKYTDQVREKYPTFDPDKGQYLPDDVHTRKQSLGPYELNHPKGVEFGENDLAPLVFDEKGLDESATRFQDFLNRITKDRQRSTYLDMDYLSSNKRKRGKNDPELSEDELNQSEAPASLRRTMMYDSYVPNDGYEKIYNAGNVPLHDPKRYRFIDDHDFDYEFDPNDKDEARVRRNLEEARGMEYTDPKKWGYITKQMSPKKVWRATNKGIPERYYSRELRKLRSKGLI